MASPALTVTRSLAPLELQDFIGDVFILVSNLSHAISVENILLEKKVTLPICLHMRTTNHTCAQFVGKLLTESMSGMYMKDLM